MSIPFSHISVLSREVLSFFQDKAGCIIVDATAGGGGHLKLLADVVLGGGKIYAFDQDPRAHKEDAAGGVAALYKDRIKLFHAPFSHVKKILSQEGVLKIDGLLCDLGVSSNQLDDRSRGFSFLADGPIDMRMDTSKGMTAYEWLAASKEEDIANAIFTFGGEKKSRSIARKIKQSWPIENSTLALANLVVSAMRQKKWSKTHPATRTFQGIRIAVNHEMDELLTLLKDAPLLLAVGGVLVFISFHSLEDRIIKTTFKALDDHFTILTKKPIVAKDDEIELNRRARSAKLRAVMRTS